MARGLRFGHQGSVRAITGRHPIGACCPGQRTVTTFVPALEIKNVNAQRPTLGLCFERLNEVLLTSGIAFTSVVRVHSAKQISNREENELHPRPTTVASRRGHGHRPRRVASAVAKSARANRRGVLPSSRSGVS